jgi:hypothetical protein
MSDPTHGLFQLLESWGPLLIFIAVWLFVMRRYTGQYKQPWDQIERRLEAIENHLARIANILEDRRGR